MADDTRQQEDLSKEALNLHPENKPFTGAQWQSAKEQTFKPPENANMLPGGTDHTAGGKTPEYSISNAFEGKLKWSDFMDLPKRPCVRDSFMTGIGAGFALGGVRTIFGGEPNPLNQTEIAERELIQGSNYHERLQLGGLQCSRWRSDYA